MADTSVKYFHSEMAGAPVLSALAGSLIGVLDACLVSGFGQQQVISLAVESGTATAIVQVGHPFEEDVVVAISGATQGELNGEHRLTFASATEVKFDTSAPDGTATGTITIKVAPANWEKQFAGANLAAYKITDPAGTGAVLRVDDSNVGDAKVRAYRSMSGIDSGDGAFPTVAKLAGGLYWAKSSANTNSPRRWVVVADQRAVFVCIGYFETYPTSYHVNYFGDIKSYKIGDAYACALSGYYMSYRTSDAVGTAYSSMSVLGNNFVIERGYNSLDESVSGTISLPGASGSVVSGSSGFPPYPPAIDGVLRLAEVMIKEGTTFSSPDRGALPGFYFSLNYINNAVASKQKVPCSGALPGRKLMGITHRGSFGASFIDIVGPWSR